MSPRTVRLQCPSCGGTADLDSAQVSFGLKFQCAFCRTTSILVIDNQLYEPRPGEVACPECGRVSPPTASFCQCGVSLRVACTNCLDRIPLSHTICDHCGWPRAVDPHTDKGRMLRAARWAESLTDPDPAVRLRAATQLASAPEIAPETMEKIVAALKEWPSDDPEGAMEAIRSLSRTSGAPGLADLLVEVARRFVHDGRHPMLQVVCEELSRLGPTAASTIPWLLDWFSVVSSNLTRDSRQSNDSRLLFSLNFHAICNVLQSIGAEASTAVPTLMAGFSVVPANLRPSLVDTFAAIGPGAQEALTVLLDAWKAGGTAGGPGDPHPRERIARAIGHIDVTADRLDECIGFLSRAERHQAVLSGSSKDVIPDDLGLGVMVRAIGPPATPSLRSVRSRVFGSRRMKHWANELIQEIERGEA